MSKISDTLNTISEFPNNGDPHWCASNKSVAKTTDLYDETDVFKNAKTVEDIKKKVLDTEKRLMAVADKLCKNLNISRESAEEFIGSKECFDIFKDAYSFRQGKEVVDHPSHYNHGKYECIDVIDDLKLNFNLGSAFKYIWRMGLKDDEVTELEKAVWYLQREIENRKRAKNEKENQ